MTESGTGNESNHAAMHPTSVLQCPSFMRDACPDPRKRTHETGQGYLGEAPSPQRASARPNPGSRRVDRISMWSVARPLQKRAPNASPAIRAHQRGEMTWLAMSATANRTNAASSGNGGRTCPVSIDAGFDNVAQSGHSTATVFCRAARSAAVADSLALLRLSTAASRFAMACKTAAMIASPNWRGRHREPDRRQTR